MDYDIIIPVTKRHISVIQYCINGLIQHLLAKKIVIIGKRELKNAIINRKNEEIVEFIDEDSVVPGMTLFDVEGIIEEKDPYAKARAGWYFQQFIKLGYSLSYTKEYYISWDSDTILLNDIEMFDVEGIPFFDMKKEINYPYFTTIKKLFDGKISKTTVDSYISEHMIFKTDYVKEMIKEFCDEKETKYFWKTILKSIENIDVLLSGFSEYETYGNYTDTRHFESYRHRSLNTYRNAERVYGNVISDDLLKCLSKDYDTVTFENRNCSS